ncbi:hypothetical protein BCR33DRAFT_761572 [Rhizoclosmatium globosum]|uniref:Essential protein Yae1 N-terminal domain-containing protein n=1 Tax=Rhizoclosmatium globosum TaxID=329046 RepID=A0A1Y2CZ98_9FUNG|nr:hypothetical protein BCR33DRAFT_761572 [Rhizoclosmatium globosum]|eukprot:ORY52349.1 hypothetical protein BCR33DRAFT_761572 [Rhizoclosmatium globosum]
MSNITTAETPTADLTTAMDSLLHLETMLEQSGYDDGLRDGLALGLEEGRDLGQRIAIKTAREVGYYLGVCQELLESLASQPEAVGVVVHSRAAKVLESTKTLCELFPHTNDHAADIVPLLEKIRGKFTLATVLLKMPQLKFNLETNVPTETNLPTSGTQEVNGTQVSHDDANSQPTPKPDFSF